MPIKYPLQSYALKIQSKERRKIVLNFDFPSISAVTTDVQTASILFFETFVSIGCTFAAESQALGCVVTLELGEEGEGGGGGEGVGRETFWLQRERGSSDVSQCNRTANSRSVCLSHIMHIVSCPKHTRPLEHTRAHPP